MEFTKSIQISGIAIFLDFEKHLILSNEITFIRAFQVSTFVLNYRPWDGVLYKKKSISSCVLNNEHVSKHFFYNVEYVRVAFFQGCYL